jgi:Na+/glutamate symporter
MGVLSGTVSLIGGHGTAIARSPRISGRRWPSRTPSMALIADVALGASHMAFIIVPRVAAFFIDLVNALTAPFFLGNF